MAWICNTKSKCDECRFLGFDEDQLYTKGDGNVCVALEDVYDCPICGKPSRSSEMTFTYDCHGIPFRRVCLECYDKIMEDKGYDGQYYTELDECIDDEW